MVISYKRRIKNQSGQALVEATVSTALVMSFCIVLFQLLSGLLCYAVLKSNLYNFGICELSVKPYPFFCQQRIEKSVNSLFPKIENFKYNHVKSNNAITVYAEGKVWSWIPIKINQSISI